MKNKDLIKLLQEYPEDVEVSLLGKVYEGCGDWSMAYLSGVKLDLEVMDFDEEYNELF